MRPERHSSDLPSDGNANDAPEDPLGLYDPFRKLKTRSKTKHDPQEAVRALVDYAHAEGNPFLMGTLVKKIDPAALDAPVPQFTDYVPRDVLERALRNGPVKFEDLEAALNETQKHTLEGVKALAQVPPERLQERIEVEEERAAEPVSEAEVRQLLNDLARKSPEGLAMEEQVLEPLMGALDVELDDEDDEVDETDFSLTKRKKGEAEPVLDADAAEADKYAAGIEGVESLRPMTGYEMLEKLGEREMTEEELEEAKREEEGQRAAVAAKLAERKEDTELIAAKTSRYLELLEETQDPYVAIERFVEENKEELARIAEEEVVETQLEEFGGPDAENPEEDMLEEGEESVDAESSARRRSGEDFVAGRKDDEDEGGEFDRGPRPPRYEDPDEFAEEDYAAQLLEEEGKRESLAENEADALEEEDFEDEFDLDGLDEELDPELLEKLAPNERMWAEFQLPKMEGPARHTPREYFQILRQSRYLEKREEKLIGKPKTMEQLNFEEAERLNMYGDDPNVAFAYSHIGYEPIRDDIYNRAINTEYLHTDAEERRLQAAVDGYDAGLQTFKDELEFPPRRPGVRPQIMEAMMLLNEQDPKTWNIRTLSQRFGVRADRVAVILRVMRIEKRAELLGIDVEAEPSAVRRDGRLHAFTDFIPRMPATRALETGLSDTQVLNVRAADMASIQAPPNRRIKPRSAAQRQPDGAKFPEKPRTRPLRYPLLVSDTSKRGEDMDAYVRMRSGGLRYANRNELVRVVQIEVPFRRDRRHSIVRDNRSLLERRIDARERELRKQGLDPLSKDPAEQQKLAAAVAAANAREAAVADAI